VGIGRELRPPESAPWTPETVFFRKNSAGGPDILRLLDRLKMLYLFGSPDIFI